MKDERDTHFAGFAKLLQQELNAAYHVKVMQLQGGIAIDPTVWEQEVQQMIAQRAYDLVYHTMEHTTQAMAAENEHRPAIAENMHYIPDLTPQTPESSPAPGP